MTQSPCQVNEVYSELLPVIETKRDTTPSAIVHIPGLAEETYKEGMSVLSDALQNMSAIHSPAIEMLEKEMIELEREMDTSMKWRVCRR